MKTKILSILSLLALAFGALAPVTPAQAKAGEPSAPSDIVSPAGMLNTDGTLALDGSFSGALDLEGYGVALDPSRGPVFGPAQAAAPGQWAALGEGGGAITDQVRGIAVDGTDVYVAGYFTDAANIPAADYIVKWDGAAWSALGSDNMGDGAISSGIYSLAVANGNVYVGGYFSSVHNGATQVSTASNIARWDGSTWSGLGNNGANGGALNNVVYAIAVDASGNVYAGGGFTDVNNKGTVIPEADYIAKWNPITGDWSALGNNGAGVGALGAGVNVIATSGTDIYVGGNFTNAGGMSAADYVAKWNGSAWSALGNNGAANNGSITGGYVNALAVSGTDVYVGGLFTDVNNGGSVLGTADFLAKWDGANWSALGSNGANGAFNQAVYSILVNGTDVYVGGYFTNAAGLATADYLAKWDGANWNALGDNGAGNGAIPNKSGPFVFSLAMQAGNLLAGGYFWDVNDGNTPQLQADYLAQWDGTHWSALGVTANGALVNGYESSQTYAILVNGTDVYVGGNFYNVSNHGLNIPEADGIVKWDSLTGDWSALGSNGAGDGAIAGTVASLALSGTNLFVGGTFNNAAGIAEADKIAKFNLTTQTWSALGNNGAGVGAFANGSYIASLVVNGTDLYAGGNFTDVAGIAEADYIAKWDGATWSALGNNGAGVGAFASGSYIASLAVNGTDVYAGGIFTDAAGIAAADHIAKWNGASWSALGASAALTNSVYTLAASGADLYVGGSFVNAAGLANADYLAKWDGTNWSAVGSSPLNNQVRALAVSGSDVFVGGLFTNAGGVSTADYLARWDGTQWSALGNDGAGNGSIKYYGNVPVYAFASMGSDLLVGGRFSDLSNNGTILPEADYIAAYGIPPHVPTTYTVTKLADADDGVCDVADCSLREAISVAVDSDSIVFAAGLSGGTITLASPLTVAKDIAIVGGTVSNLITLSGNDAVRLFNIQSGAAVQLSYLTLTHGYVLDDNGGAILNNGGLTLSHVIVSNSEAESTNSSFGNGGGIYSASHASLTLTNSSQITTNTASYSGGGIYAAVNSGAVLSLTNSKVDHNTASLGHGGGLYLPNPGTNAAGTITIANSAITDNSTSGGGGGGIFLGASATIARSYIINNSSGAFANGGGGLKIYESGGTDKPITVRVENVTVSGNTTLGQGGGVDVSLQQAADSVTFNNVTIAGNARNVLPGPPAPNGGGGIFASGLDQPNLMNSIIAGNTSGVGGADCEGAFHSQDYNLIQDTTNCTLNGSTTHNVTGVSANLSALTTVNGTQVMIPQYGSPAINAGNNFTCSSQDQTGFNRSTMGAPCDMGAYEADSIAPTVTSIVRASANPTSANSVDFTVTFSESVTGVDTGDFTLTTSGVSSAAVSGISGSGNLYTLTVSVGAGSGVLRLDLPAGSGIADLSSNPLAGTPYTGGEEYTVSKPVTFADVPSTYWAWRHIERLYSAGITGGCSATPLNYCPETPVTRAQMAVFLLVAKHGAGYTPPPASGLFSDVPVVGYGYAAWIEQMANEAITGGCGGGNFCPNAPVTREQMAVFLLVAKHGTGYNPPAAVGLFSDVPANNGFARWIEQLAAEGITGGCGGGKFCPQTPVTRAQMAVFLVAAFNLP
ncbi:MAG: S-layer homology domain-containing protein [Chloroflexi bacterium]|nr:S-layer homology domain-containing protein [Chloroflexota bacterium]